MAKQTMIDTTLLAGNASECIDLSGYANSLLFNSSVEEIDATTIEDLCRRRLGSLRDASFNFDVFDDDGGDPWKTLTDMFATVDCLYGWIESNASMAEQDRGVFVRALESSFSKGGDAGSAAMLSVSGNGDGPMIFAQVLQEDESLTVTGNSTGFEFGALATGETLYCAQWVQSVDAGSIVGTIESDTTGFGSPTTQGTFASATGATAELITVAGPVTDTFWRYEYTITTGPAVVVCMIGKV